MTADQPWFKLFAVESSSWNLLAAHFHRDLSPRGHTIMVIALNFSLFDFRFIIIPFRNNRRKQNWCWSKKQLKGVNLNSFKRSSSFDYLQDYYHLTDVIIMTSFPLQNWLENLPVAECWKTDFDAKMIVRKLKLLILNQMWSIQIFQSHYSVNWRLSQNLSGLSKILEMAIFSTKILHVYCMCDVIIPERFRICYLASESCDLHVISTIKIFLATVCATCIFIE